MKERQKLIEAAQTIKEFCGKNKCSNCCFFYYDYEANLNVCSLTEDSLNPESWELPELPEEPQKMPATPEIKNDNVNHPGHYTAGGVECIDAIEAATTNLTGIEAVCTGNVIKYVWRWKLKNGAEDLKKAAWYLHKLIKKLDPTWRAGE